MLKEFKIISGKKVTILVLVEMSLQYIIIGDIMKIKRCHNPCFSRNVFAIIKNRWDKIDFN